MVQLLPRPSVTRKTFSLYPATRPLFGNGHGGSRVRYCLPGHLAAMSAAEGEAA